MARPSSTRSAESGRVLFVAREPDETLRTFLPVIDRLREHDGLASRVLFHHRPGEWARAELARRGVGLRRVRPPHRKRPTGPRATALSRYAATVEEIGRLARARSLAQGVLARERPAAIVVIQDTLLLERFLVREANRRGLPTVVAQWAFSYPQSMYDRLRAIQLGTGVDGSARRDGSRARRLLAPATRAAYRGVLAGLGLSFDLANSYGGGEARLFTVWGEAFKEQYAAQGVRDKRIVVTGHPSHDAAFARAATLDDRERARIRERYGLPPDGMIVLYATQPVLWRRVIGPAELEANVRAIAQAVAASPGGARLVLKLHPRERAEDYAFCAALEPPVRVIPRAEMADLVAACDAFVSSSSSTVLLAMMLGRPIVTVNFNRVPHFDFFEPLGGTLHTRTPAEFAGAIRLALADDPTRERLARERRDVLARYTRFDGRATERIAGLIAQAIAESRGRIGAR
jgi:CDP-Glycerol:Poly(glycerophosphate) glycerophosphotransferase